MNAEGVIRFLLRLMGLICVVALVPTVMPLSWMKIAHEWLGMGKFPDQPIAEYMARGMSLLCAFYGGLLLIISKDVRGYLPLVRYQAIFMCCAAAFGLLMTGRIGLPAKYLIFDAIAGLLIMVPVLILSFRMKKVNATGH